MDVVFFNLRFKNTGYLFLVDTGAQIRVIPPGPKQKHTLSTLQVAIGSKIQTYGEVLLTLNLSSQQPLPLIFTRARIKNSYSWSGLFIPFSAISGYGDTLLFQQ